MMASNNSNGARRLSSSAREAFKAALLYGTLGVLWIILSDSLLNLWFQDPLAARHYQTYKGWFYVCVTAVLAYAVLKRALSRVERAQAVVEAEKNRLMQVVEHMPILMDASDEHGRILVWNGESERVTGYSSGEMVSNPKAIELLYPDAAYRQRMFADARYQGAQFSGWEWEVTCKDGARRIIAWSSIAGRVSVPGWASWRVGVDVTERRRAEDELRNAHQRLAFHVNNSPLAYIEWDSERRVQRWSPQAVEIFGWTEREALGKTDAELRLVPPEDMAEVDETVKGLIGGTLARGVLANRNYRKDGAIIHCEWYNSALYGESGKVESLLSQVQDVTERVESQEERQRLEAQVQHAQKLESLGVLAGGIAHDFNNLLVGILGNADLALLSLPEKGEARECLMDLVVSAQHAAELCKQMLAYSGRGRFVVEPVDVNGMLRSMGSLIQASISKRAVLNLLLAEKLPLIEADAAQLRQVFMNLLINASDALGDDDGRIDVSSSVEFCDRDYFDRRAVREDLAGGEYVRVEIRDSGCGMDPETQRKIFEPFFTTKFTGRGLGLAAVLGIMRGHRGAITVSSAPGEGAAFTLYFPVAAGVCEAFGGIGECFGADGARVLVVDNEPMVRSLAQRSLESAGYVVSCAANGAEALDLLKRHRDEFHAMLLDLNLPTANGQILFSTLRSLTRGLPIVVTSGYSEEESVSRLGVAGLDAYLQKPYSAQELVEKLSFVIARARAGHQKD